MPPSGRSAAPWVAVLLGVLSAAALAAKRPASSGDGAVCIAPTPAAGYTVRFDQGPEVRVSAKASVGVGGLAVGRSHVVTVRRDGRLEDLLRFDFAGFESRFLCLSLDASAGAWTLKEMKRSEGVCLCSSGATSAAGLPGWPAASEFYDRGVDGYAQGRLKDAVRSFEEVLEIDPHNTSAKRAINRVRREIAADSPAPESPSRR